MRAMAASTSPASSGTLAGAGRATARRSARVARSSSSSRRNFGACKGPGRPL